MSNRDVFEPKRSTWTGWIVPGVGLLIAGALLVWTLAPHDSPRPSPSATPGPTIAAGGIHTADGLVYLRAGADGEHLELVLEKSDGTTIVLVAIPEKVPLGGGSSHTVDCPPATGLAQRYYALGQSDQVGVPELSGLAGAVAGIVDGFWLVAVTSNPIPPGEWRVSIGDQQFAGGFGSTFLDLPASGERSEAGCFYFR
jgi:hypothetical protein